MTTKPMDTVCMWLVLAVGMISGSPTITDTTYPITLPNGKEIRCNLCPPGTYLYSRCNDLTHNSVCIECPQHTFQTFYNQAGSCADCSSCPMRFESIYKKCNATSDTECRCDDGYYLKSEGSSEGVCLPLDKCPKGYGVSIEGNYARNTECEECQDGYFSPNDSSTLPCQRCSTCPGGQQIWQMCTSQSDTLCEPRTEDSNLSGGVIAGIICGVLLPFLFIICCCCFWKARNGEGPKFTQNLCKIYKQKNLRNKNRTTNGYRYTPGDDTDTDDHKKLLAIFPDLSLDLIDNEWKFFFVYLFGSELYIKEVEINKPNNVRLQIHTLLTDWVAREKEKATVDRLVRALKDHKRLTLIEKYFKTQTQANGDATVTEV